MSLIYRLLLQHSKLSANGAARLHQVTVGQVKEWTRYKAAAPTTAIKALRELCRDESEPPDERAKTGTLRQ